MEKGKRRVSPILAVGGASVLLVGAVYGPKAWQAYDIEQRMILAPARALPERIAELAKLGVELEGDQIDSTKLELVPHYQNVVWRVRAVEVRETDAIAVTLLSDVGEMDRLKKLADSPPVNTLPTYRDFLYKQSPLATKRATNSLRTYAEKAIREGRTADVLQALEMIHAVQAVDVQISSEAGLIHWFGANADLLRLVDAARRMPELTTRDREKLKMLVAPDQPIPHLRSLVTRIATEMMILTGKLGQLSKDEEAVLEFAVEQAPVPDFKQKSKKEAIRSRLAGAWIDVLNNHDFSESPERLGYEIDAELMKKQGAARGMESDYMILAVPIKFEVFGRMIARILQGRAVVGLALSGDLKPGVKSVTVSGYSYDVTVTEADDRWEVASRGLLDFGDYNKSSGLEINQGLGVRLIEPK